MRRVMSGLGIAAALFVIGCGGDDVPTNGNGNGNGNGDIGPPASIAPVSGDGQRIVVDATLLDPLVVRVADSNGAGVSGVRVDWEVTSGSGSLSSSATTTGADGLASVDLTAGASQGEIVVSAVVEGLSGFQVTFTSTVVTPVALAPVRGDGQSARILQPLALPFEVKVTAGDGGTAPGATVDWAVTAGGGTVSASSSSADQAGLATTTLTLGSATGANSVLATVDGLMTSFDATGTTPVSVTIDMTGIAFVVPPAARPTGGGSDDALIQLGDTIIWVNLDAVAHTATSTRMPDGGLSFDSGNMGQNDTFTFVPNTRGSWIYFCVLHPTIMVDARIQVD